MEFRYAGLLEITPQLDIAPLTPQAEDENGAPVETGERAEIHEG